MDDHKLTIAVCGDSYCAASIIDLKMVGLRAHFSQILEDRYGHTVLQFAHGAFSNVGICFQIQEAIKQRPDVIVYNDTWSSRLELPVGRWFDPIAGLKNFVYYDQHTASTHQPWAGDMDAPMLSTVPQGIEFNPLVSSEQLQAIKQYLTYMYNDALAITVDSWLFGYWHDQIEANSIQALRFKDQDIGAVAYEFSDANRDYDTPFHTDRATQEQIAANIHHKLVDRCTASQ